MTQLVLINDLKDKTVGAKIGTESADFLEANKDKYGYSIKYLDTTDALYSALEINEIEAMMDDYPVIGYGIAQGQPLSTPIPREEGGSYGFAVKKGKNAELVEMFNEGLAELKRTGEYDEIVGKYVKDGSVENTVDESTFIGMIQNNWKRLLSGPLDDCSVDSDFFRTSINPRCHLWIVQCISG